MGNVTWTRMSPECVGIDINIPHGYSNWSQRFLLSADRHHDNPDCDDALELKHLKECKKHGAYILDFGDFFCAMQGKYDKRSNKEKVRPEHQRDDYLNALVETAIERYKPYADRFILISKGNHETSIIDKHGTDLIEQTVGGLNAVAKSKIVAGGYSGWVWFKFKRGEFRQSLTLWYIHGYGGDSPVTLGTIQKDRQMVYTDADILVSGHNHNSFLTERVRNTLNAAGRVERKVITCVNCPSYKDEYQKGQGGYQVQRGSPPKPLGAWWLTFRVDADRKPIVEITKAT